MKNDCCLVARLFKILKTGVFLFGISFFVSEKLKFLYYTNYQSDDVMRFATKMVKY